MPISRQPLYFPQASQHGFVCVAPNTLDMAAFISNYTGSSAGQSFSGFCSDGLNDAGLSAAFLWDEDNKGYAQAPPSSGPPNATAGDLEVVTYFDYPSRVLAECSTIDCARDLTSRLSIVNSYATSAFFGLLLGMKSVPIHATFCDRSARCIVVEWTRAGGIPEIFDLKQGVLTNEPQLPIQEKMLAAYLKDSGSKYGDSALLNWPGGSVVFNTSTGHEIVEPSARFIRMAMLMQLYGPVPYPTPASYASPSHYGSKVSAFSQINSIMVRSSKHLISVQKLVIYHECLGIATAYHVPIHHLD